MEAYYEIADLLLKVTSESALPGFLAGFEALSEEREQALVLRMNKSLEGTYGVCHQVLPEGTRHLLANERDGSCWLTADENWRSVQLWAGKTQVQEQMELFAAAFYSRLSREGGLLLHASAVEYQGKSVVFLAPSGTGKTTQAELWQTHLGARILNGDKVFLRKRGEQICAFGSPWKGSSPYGENACAPVAALVVLEQGKENVLEKLEGVQGVQAVMSHLFYPGWDKDCMDAVMDTADRTMTALPVFKLTCRPDRESVMLLKKGVYL